MEKKIITVVVEKIETTTEFTPESLIALLTPHVGKSRAVQIYTQDNYPIEIKETRLETDADFEKRKAESESYLAWKKKQDYQQYLHLKKVFEAKESK